MQIVRGLLTTDGFTFEGKHFQVKDATLLPRPVQQPHPPIWIGASGEKRTMPIAARYADVWHCFGPPEYLDRQVGADQRARRGRRAATRATIRRAASLSIEADLDGVAAHGRRVGGRRLRLPRVRLAGRGPGPVEEFAGRILP